MIITRTSLVSGKQRQREIPIKPDDYVAWLNGKAIQSAAPYLSADDREFLLSGITPEEWDAEFKEED